jgi:hypothetical protein
MNDRSLVLAMTFVRELSYAKDIQDMLRIQMEFMRSQMEAFGEQAKDLGEAYIKAPKMAPGHYATNVGPLTA